MLKFFKVTQNENEASTKKNSEIISIDDAIKSRMERSNTEASYEDSIYAINRAINRYIAGENDFPQWLYDRKSNRISKINLIAKQEAEEKGYCFIIDRDNDFEMIDLKKRIS